MTWDRILAFMVIGFYLGLLWSGLHDNPTRYGLGPDINDGKGHYCQWACK